MRMRLLCLNLGLRDDLRKHRSWRLDCSRPCGQGIFSTSFPKHRGLCLAALRWHCRPHPDHGFAGNERQWWHDQLHGFDFNLPQCWTGLREPALNGVLEFACFRDTAVPKGPTSSLS
jgi:hypothetical protein